MTTEEFNEAFNGALRVKKCPFCGSDGSTGIWFDPLTEKWSTDFNCDADAAHHCFIIRLPPTVFEETEG